MSTWQSDKVFETKVGFVWNILFLGHFNWQSRNEKHENWNYYPRKEFQRWIEFRPQHGTERRKQVLETWKFSQGTNSRPFCAIMTLISPTMAGWGWRACTWKLLTTSLPENLPACRKLCSIAQLGITFARFQQLAALLHYKSFQHFNVGKLHFQATGCAAG